MSQSRTTALVAPVLVALTVALAGCASPGDGDPQPAGAPQPTVVTIPGVASCAELPRRSPAADAPPDGLPSLRLPCLTAGPAVELAALGGRGMVVNLWASWCGPCRAEMPVLQAGQERYGEQVQFLGVDTKDTVSAAGAFLEFVDVTYPQVGDPDGTLLTHVGLPGLPVTLAVDRDGRVVDTHVGQLDRPTLDALVAGLLP